MKFRLVTYEGSIKQGYEIQGHVPNLNPRPNLDLGILVPHFGSTPGLKSRPNLGLGTLVPYSYDPKLKKSLTLTTRFN